MPLNKNKHAYVRYVYKQDVDISKNYKQINIKMEYNNDMMAPPEKLAKMAIIRPKQISISKWRIITLRRHW